MFAPTFLNRDTDTLINFLLPFVCAVIIYSLMIWVSHILFENILMLIEDGTKASQQPTV